MLCRDFLKFLDTLVLIFKDLLYSKMGNNRMSKQLFHSLLLSSQEQRWLNSFEKRFELWHSDHIQSYFLINHDWSYSQFSQRQIFFSVIKIFSWQVFLWCKCNVFFSPRHLLQQIFQIYKYWRMTPGWCLQEKKSK